MDQFHFIVFLLIAVKLLSMKHFLIIFHIKILPGKRFITLIQPLDSF